MDYMYLKAHCIRQFGFEYRRHGYPDPIFSIYKWGSRFGSKILKTYHPLIEDWMEFVVSFYVQT
jgi:hypothetical protein